MLLAPASEETLCLDAREPRRSVGAGGLRGGGGHAFTAVIRAASARCRVPRGAGLRAPRQPPQMGGDRLVTLGAFSPSFVYPEYRMMYN